MMEASDSEPYLIIDADLEEILPVYLARKKDDIEALRQFLAADNFESVQRIGHNLKGSGAGYGLNRISELGAEIEAVAKLKQKQRLESLIKDLEDFLGRLRIKFETS